MADKRKTKGNVKKTYNMNILLHQSPSIKEEIEPVDRLTDSEISISIQEVLESKQRKDLTQLQTYAYPILSKRCNLVIVSNPHSGKTLASVVGLLTAVNDAQFYENLKGHGPKLIFLTSLSKNLDIIMKMCKTLLRKQKELIVQKVYSWDSVKEMTLKLAPGCDVLITSPRCLDSMLEAKHLINVDRLCHVVFDDVDYMFNNSLKEVQRILTLIQKLEECRGDMKYNVQKVVLAEKWSGILKWFVRTVMKNNGFICIPTNNLLEGAVYGNVKPFVEFIRHENKINAIKSLIASVQGTMRTVIVCNNVIETLKLHNELDPICQRLLMAHDNMNHISVEGIKKAWQTHVDGLHEVMLCTDDVLPELEITDADILVHCQLPLSKTSFSSRFMCILDKCPNIFVEDTLAKCKVYIFIDEENDEQFPELLTYMKRFKLPISKKLQNVVSRINIQKEKSKKSLMLCENLKQYGSCWRIAKCFFRHMIFPDVDEVDDIPKSGFVKITVTCLHDVGHVSVILLEHKVNDEWVTLPNIDQCAIISLEMSSHFAIESNRKMHVKPSINDIVAIERDNIFYRASVVYINKFEDKVVAVCVKRLDYGDIIDVKPIDLYYLPDYFKKTPPLAVDVYMCNMQPIDDVDYSWSVAAFCLVDKLLTRAKREFEIDGDSCYLCGKIVLCIERNLWLDPLTHSKKLKSTNSEVYISSIRHELIESKMAVEKRDHLQLLYALCKTAGLKLPSTRSFGKTTQLTEKVQWAHLDRDECSEVTVTAIENPNMFFVKVTKFSDRLQQLETEIDKLSKKLLKAGDVGIGDMCLAYYPDEKTWNRAKVLKFPTPNKINVFYADHGDYGTVQWDHLAKIPTSMLTTLPLQAIECRLAGIQKFNVKDDWSERASSLMYDLVEYEEGVWKPLIALVCQIDLKAAITGGRRYGVALLDIDTKPIGVVNNELVIEREAIWLVDEKNWLDNVCNEYENSVAKQSNQNLAKDDDVECWDDCTNEDFNFVNKKENVGAPVEENLNSLNLDEDDIEISDMKTLLQDWLKIDLPEHLMNQLSIEDTPLPPLPENELLSITDCKSTTSNSRLSTISSVNSDAQTGTSDLDVTKLDFSLLNAHVRKRKNQNLKFASIGTAKCLDYVYEQPVVKEDISEEDDENIPGLETVNCNYRTPFVEWHQNAQYVWLRILITDVKYYDLYISTRSLLFRCENENGSDSGYLLTLDFYGPVFHQSVEQSAKGFHVSVRMKKALQGSHWPSLVLSEKNYNWIKVNPEHVGYESDEDNVNLDDFAQGCESSDSDSSEVIEPDDLEDHPLEMKDDSD